MSKVRFFWNKYMVVTTISNAIEYACEFSQYGESCRIESLDGETVYESSNREAIL